MVNHPIILLILRNLFSRIRNNYFLWAFHSWCFETKNLFVSLNWSHQTRLNYSIVYNLLFSSTLDNISIFIFVLVLPFLHHFQRTCPIHLFSCKSFLCKLRLPHKHQRWFSHTFFILGFVRFRYLSIGAWLKSSPHTLLIPLIFLRRNLFFKSSVTSRYHIFNPILNRIIFQISSWSSLV